MMNKSPRVFINHILESIDAIQQYTSGMDKQAFLANRLVQDAVIRNFEIIGEAAKSISNPFREQHSHIPWKQMAGMRDVLIHEYMSVDLEAVWTTVEENLPKLKQDLEVLSF